MTKDAHLDIDDATDSDERSLLPEAGCGGEEGDLEFDEDGTLIRPNLPFPLVRPCNVQALDGSWLITLVPRGPFFPSPTRGPMRIEVEPAKLRISGDIYVHRRFGRLPPPVIGSPFVPGSLVIRKNWYPAFPQREYRWYFRSLGVRYSRGKLTFRFERHLWSQANQEFVQVDTGRMELECEQSLIRPIGAPRPTLQMTGTATIGGTFHQVTATKTSPYYRGCLVEVDVMTNRSWPSFARSCDGGRTFSFTGVYREAGLDFRAVVNEIDLPEDQLLTVPEMHQLLATHRSLSAGGDNWHLWLLVGSRIDGTLGLMFDTGNPPHREGAVGFFDPTLSNSPLIEASARGQKLGDVPLAFLRTLIHEAGHAFNLFHPKHDVHNPPIGTTIMNQTGDVIGFATVNNPYPCNATFAFSGHNQTSLRHSPDPQVKPGWKQFGWGHGSASSGIAEPIDVEGLDDGGGQNADLRLSLDLPAEACRGEFVWATVTVTNEGDAPREVSAALNLAEGDLRAAVTAPDGERIDARDVVVLCGERRMVTLQPGESISGQVQLFYTPHGLTFDQPGRYRVQATFDVGDAEGSVLRSAERDLVVRSAVSEQERELERLAMDRGVGLSLALGDFGSDTAARQRLEAMADRCADTDTGAAGAMVLANALARDLRDHRAGIVVRPAETAVAERAFDAAMKGRDATRTVRLATAVVSPRDTASPLLDQLQTRLKRSRRGTYKQDDLAAAGKLMADHFA